MGVKLLCFGMIIFSFYFTSIVSEKHVANRIACSIEELAGKPCRTCDFLTFGQDEDESGLISYFCPNPSVSDTNQYCCYNIARRPYCCDKSTFLLNGFLWIVVVILIICVIGKLVKWLIR